MPEEEISTNHSLEALLAEQFALTMPPLPDPEGVDDPQVVLLSPGIYNSAYFEHVFLARGLRDSGEAHEQEEEGIVGTRRVPWAEALGMVRDGTITDGETVASLMYAAIALGRVA